MPTITPCGDVFPIGSTSGPYIGRPPNWIDGTTNPQPYTPPPMSLPGPGIFTSGGGVSTYDDEDKKKLAEYRFLVKGIRNLVNAGKLDPMTALLAIDAMLMALDDEYDKHESGTVPAK